MKPLNGVGLSVAVGMAVLAAGASAQAAPSCMKVGGWGTGALEGFASFMAEAAMKNSAKSRLGTDSPKIGAVAKKCELKGLLYECTARARACK
jgi:hypothetical protein